LEYAFALHARQYRKGGPVPYIAHLLGVTALVLEDGGDEDEAIAALLHDAVEDQGGLPTLEEIRRRFGERVAHIVEGCSDAYEIPKPAWRERKAAYLASLPSASPEVQRVSLADKVHNARALLTDLRLQDPAIWKRFNGGRDGTLWYYRSMLEIAAGRETSPLVAELARLVAEIEHLADEGNR
jgi:GTP pyrophosphokinase